MTTDNVVEGVLLIVGVIVSGFTFGICLGLLDTTIARRLHKRRP